MVRLVSMATWIQWCVTVIRCKTNLNIHVYISCNLRSQHKFICCFHPHNCTDMKNVNCIHLLTIQCSTSNELDWHTVPYLSDNCVYKSNQCNKCQNPNKLVWVLVKFEICWRWIKDRTNQVSFSCKKSSPQHYSVDFLITIVPRLKYSCTAEQSVVGVFPFIVQNIITG